MFDLLLRHARLVDDTLTNIALQEWQNRGVG
ncbi:dihydroorotase [Salmonella enterica subsp. enterica]|nr:dihydroorotase [Salmonella enterica subsp. enterica]